MLLYIIDTNMGFNVVFIKQITANCKFYFLDTLEVARKKLNIAQYKTDLTTDVESSPEGKGKRRKIARVLTSDEESIPPNEPDLCGSIFEPSTSSDHIPRRSPRKLSGLLSSSSRLDHPGSSPKRKRYNSACSSITDSISRQLEKSFGSTSKRKDAYLASPSTRNYSSGNFISS